MTPLPSIAATPIASSPKTAILSTSEKVIVPETQTFTSFITVPRANGATYAAVRAATQACADGRPTGPLLIIGAAGSGKSHLFAAAAAYLAPRLGDRLLCYGGADFIAQCDRAHFTGDAPTLRRLIQAGYDLPALRRRLARARAILLDDLWLLASHPAPERELCEIMERASLAGALILLATRAMPSSADVWARPTLRALACCQRLHIRPIRQGRAGAARIALLDQALARHDLTLPPTTLERVAGLPLAPESLATLVQLSWSEPGLSTARRLAQVRQLSQASLRERARAGRPDPASVIVAAATACHTTSQDVLGRSRRRPVAQARQVAMYLLCHTYGVTTEAVGRALGRDHSTVLHGRDRIARQMAADPAVAALVAGVRSQLIAAYTRAS